MTATRVLSRMLVASALLGAVTAMSSASAAPLGGTRAALSRCDSVHIGPQQPAGTKLNYFSVHGAPGQTLPLRLIVANPGSRPCTVALSTAVGRTALNSGNTFVPQRSRASCTGAACWLSPPPTEVTVPPETRRYVAFKVEIPAATRPGQYLAGVMGAPAEDSAGSTSRQVSVRVVTRVAIGVAVTVDGPLRPHLRIPEVTLDRSGDPLGSVLSIHETNDGNTWEHPTGHATVSAQGRSYRLPVTSNTILASNVATLRAIAAGVPKGTHPTRVVLWYAGHTKKAVWGGDLTFGPPAQVDRSADQIIVTRPSAQPPDRLPTWLWWLLGVVGLLVLLLLGFIFLLLWRRRRDEDDEDQDKGKPTHEQPVSGLNQTGLAGAPLSE